MVNKVYVHVEIDKNKQTNKLHYIHIFLFLKSLPIQLENLLICCHLKIISVKSYYLKMRKLRVK